MRADTYLTVANARSKAERWLAGLPGRARLRLDPARCALLVVDAQRFFAHPEGASYLPSSKAATQAIEALLAAWRSRGRPVAFTRHCHRPGEADGMLMGFWGSVIRCSSPDSALLETLGRRPVEPVFRKTTYDGFHGTGLEDWFREKGVRQLLAVGFLTHLCVETTVRSAFVRGLQPLVAADATATVSEEMHVASLRAMHHGFAGVLSSQAVLKELGGS